MCCLIFKVLFKWQQINSSLLTEFDALVALPLYQKALRCPLRCFFAVPFPRSFSRWQLIYYIMLFFFCQDFFEIFLRIFLKSFLKNNFDILFYLAPFERCLSIISNLFAFVKSFLNFFQTFFLKLKLFDITLCLLSSFAWKPLDSPSVGSLVFRSLEECLSIISH